MAESAERKDIRETKVAHDRVKEKADAALRKHRTLTGALRAAEQAIRRTQRRPA